MWEIRQVDYPKANKTEYRILHNRNVVAATNDKSYANLIVTACNSYQELVEALTDLFNHLSNIEGGRWINNAPGQRAAKAILKAKGG